MRTPSGCELPRVLTPALAARVGISRSRVRTELRRGAWRRLAAGAVLTRPDEPTRLDWAEAGVVLGGRTAALSGWDAVRVHGLRQPPRLRPAVLVLVREGRSRRTGPVLLRRTQRPYRVTLTGGEHPLLPLTPVVEPARAVADAALLVDDLNAVRTLVARAVQARLCTVDDLATELGRGPRNGSGPLRRALDEVAAGARSAAEASALAQLRRSTLPEFELNVSVTDASGTLLYVLDVLWRRLRAALEIDSREFHFARDDWQATMHRHNSLTAASLSVVHYPPSRIMRTDGAWLVDVERWLRARAVEIGTRYVPGSAYRPMPIGESAPLVVPAGLVVPASTPR